MLGPLNVTWDKQPIWPNLVVNSMHFQQTLNILLISNLEFLQCEDGNNPIFIAAHNGRTEIVKILAPLTDNPNAPNTIDETPIYWAARNRHAEIVKILTPFTNNSRKKVAGLGTLVILCLILLCLYYFSFSIFFY